MEGIFWELLHMARKMKKDGKPWSWRRRKLKGFLRILQNTYPFDGRE